MFIIVSFTLAKHTECRTVVCVTHFFTRKEGASCFVGASCVCQNTEMYSSLRKNSFGGEIISKLKNPNKQVQTLAK